MQFLCARYAFQGRESLCSCMRNSLKMEQKLFQQTVSSVLYLPQGLAIATCEMTLPSRVTALFPVYPDEAPQLEAAKDSSLPRLLDAKDNGIRELAAQQGVVLPTSLLRGKEEKMTSHQTITDTNTFVKSSNTQRFYKILARHCSTLTKRNNLSTSLIRQGEKSTTLQLMTL